MTNREKFKVLADQIKISNQLEQDILEQGELTRIDVSNKNRTWTFQISLPHFLSHEDYLLFTHAIEEEFNLQYSDDYVMDPISNQKMWLELRLVCIYSHIIHSMRCMSVVVLV